MEWTSARVEIRVRGQAAGRMLQGSLLLGLALLAGCSSLPAGDRPPTGATRTETQARTQDRRAVERRASAAPAIPARVEVFDNLGFTITEQARISADVRADYERAVRLLEQERYREGIAVLLELTERAPDLTAPHIDLGIAYRRSGDLERAEESLQEALARNRSHPVVHNELGMVYRRTGRFAEARESYERALAVYPGFHYARRNLAILCDIYLGDLACALEHYEAYGKAVPGDEEVRIWIADIRNRVGAWEE